MLTLTRQDGTSIVLEEKAIHRSYFKEPHKVLWNETGKRNQFRNYYPQINDYVVKGYGFFEEKGGTFSIAETGLGEYMVWTVQEQRTGCKVGHPGKTPQEAYVSFLRAMEKITPIKLHDHIVEIYEGCFCGVQIRAIELVMYGVLKS